MSQALEEIRRNAAFYAKEVGLARKRLADVLEKQRIERERLQRAVDEAVARAEDYQLIADAAEATLAERLA